MAPRCREYLSPFEEPADIVISDKDYCLGNWENTSYEMACYMESGRIFYWELPRFSGMMLHASALEYKGKAYLFSGPSTVGKSTHTRQWQQTFGSAVCVFNDDKPALRRIDGKWYAYGTPWCGKDGINRNIKAELGGICFLKQGTENKIRSLSSREAILAIFSQTAKKFSGIENMEQLLQLIEYLVQEIPIYELENFPGEEAAYLSYSAMLENEQEKIP